MDIEKLLHKDVQDFILEHKSVDIKELALKKIPFEEPLRSEVLQQITSFQKAKNKLNKWTTRSGTIFPKPDLVEQSSSDICAEYKASIYPQPQNRNTCFIDLTAGLGSDSLALSEVFTSGYCIEADPASAQVLEYNLNIHFGKKLEILNGYAEDLIKNLPNVDLIYIDPQRRKTDQRGNHKQGIYNFAEMQPDILALLPQLKEKSPCILIKSSPFLDISEGIKQLGSVQEVHVVEAEGQCKEVLYFIDQQKETEEIQLIAAVCDKEQIFSDAFSTTQSETYSYSNPLNFLFEPGPALMKSGLHSSYAARHGLQKIAPMTHLYTSEDPIAPYMGRSFKVLQTLPVKKQALDTYLPDKQANISVRNFPMKPDELRKKLKLKDGGHYTIFGCTLQNGEKRLLLCEKAEISNL